ncbi:MAG: hypothetical protein NZ605_05105 [Acidimicrobiales bacterium]|nr:hypothetical protein [Acidimicrobiales bacterium]
MVRTDRVAHCQARRWARRRFLHEVTLMIALGEYRRRVDSNDDGAEISTVENLSAVPASPARYRRVFPIRRPVL